MRATRWGVLLWQQSTVVAVLDTNTDVVELLRVSLEQAGLIVFSAYIDHLRRGQLDLTAFLQLHDPQVIVYDIAPPYDAHWRLLQHVRGVPAMQGRAFVLTSTNPQRLQEIVGTRESVLELIGRPFDLEHITRAVKDASGPATPTPSQRHPSESRHLASDLPRPSAARRMLKKRK